MLMNCWKRLLLFAGALLWLFLCEMGIMRLFAYLGIAGYPAAMLAAALIALLMTPVLYALVFRPWAEEVLSESNARYRTLAESAQDAIFIIDREERLVYVNKFGASMFKLKTEEAAGKTMRELFPQNYAQVKKNLGEVFRSKRPLLSEEELSFPAGSRWVSTRLIPTLDAKGEVRQVTGIARDVTERRGVYSHTLLQSQALEAASNGIVITDTKGSILWVNSAFSRMTGYPPEEAVGKNPRIL